MLVGGLQRDVPTLVSIVSSAKRLNAPLGPCGFVHVVRGSNLIVECDPAASVLGEAGTFAGVSRSPGKLFVFLDF
jgi:hypothetical protein